uniref:Uncharacterized protein n=2 Tax=Physcomitrium patens TaxID=3218 RepID=A0A7I4CCV0_PHYPA
MLRYWIGFVFLSLFCLLLFKLGCQIFVQRSQSWIMVTTYATQLKTIPSSVAIGENNNLLAIYIECRFSPNRFCTNRIHSPSSDRCQKCNRRLIRTQNTKIFDQYSFSNPFFKSNTKEKHKSKENKRVAPSFTLAHDYHSLARRSSSSTHLSYSTDMAVNRFQKGSFIVRMHTLISNLFSCL